ncbi:MAG: hypothetical protein VX757_09515, partial [Planctomycetota bacterium]|nr:hypothetical protein [Planctomycetota bacterium]
KKRPKTPTQTYHWSQPSPAESLFTKPIGSRMVSIAFPSFDLSVTPPPDEETRGEPLPEHVSS